MGEPGRNSTQCHQQQDGSEESFRARAGYHRFRLDGEPTDDQRDKVLWSVKELQELRPKKAVVNSFAYKADSGQFFMEKLAKDNGGRYTDVR